MHQEEKRSGLSRLWGAVSTFAIFCLLLLTLVIGSGEMLQGQMLRVGEKLFGNPAQGIQYSFLRGDPSKPTCDVNIDVEAQVQKKLNESKNDEFAGLFDEVANPDAIRQSILSAQTLCQEKYDTYEKIKSNITPGVKVYRTVETALLYITRLGVDWRQVLLMFILAIAAITTTLGLHHIALRPPSSKKDFQVYNSSMVLANTLMFVSTATYLNSLVSGDIPPETNKVIFHSLWVLLFAILTIISIVKLIKPPKTTEEGNFLKAGLSVPLYANMAIITGISFIFLMDYQSGIGIYLGQMEELSNIFLNLALFIWIGMLLKQTKVVDFFLDILRPFNFSPETLSVILMLAAGVLTAYTGASGIFVIAAGAIIYKEVFSSGARRQYALAMTAMSGSLGVVLRPCLLIVVIAALNNKVTTDALYGKGMYVFVISSSLLFIFSLFLAKEKFRLRSPKLALPESAISLKRVSPYIAIATMVVAFYAIGLETTLNEFTASVILPFVLLFILFYDKVIRDHSVNDNIEKVTPYIAVPVLVYGIYGLIKAIIGLDQGIGFSLAGFNVDVLYIALVFVALFAYRHALNIYKNRSDDEPELINKVSEDIETPKGFVKSLSLATSETIGHIGALILLMGLSISVGGLIERSEIMTAIPPEFGSTLTALMIFTFVLVLIGMVMDPFGAAILVNATIAPIAYQNGIHPVHFWIIVLAAFELGYLSPPVALNQLLARQVVGEQEMADADAEVRHKSFYWRYERWILPFVIMLITLLIVAYIPYFFKLFEWY